MILQFSNFHLNKVGSQFVNPFHVNEAVRALHGTIPFLPCIVSCFPFPIEKHRVYAFKHTDTVPLILSDIVGKEMLASLDI